MCVAVIVKGVKEKLSINIFSKGYSRYLALCLTSFVIQSVRAFLFLKDHIRWLLDYVGRRNFTWRLYVPQEIEVDLKNEDDPKNEGNLKNENDLNNTKNEDNLKN